LTHAKLDMRHTASTWLLLAAAGCGVSDAFVEGMVSEAPAITMQAVPPPAAVVSSAGMGENRIVVAGATSAPVSGGAGASGSTAAPSCRPTTYSLAVRLTVEMRWQETVALKAGAGNLYAWSKLTIVPATSTVSEFRACGSVTPVFHGTAVAGSFMSFQRVPTETYDRPSMPFVAAGSAVRAGSMLTLVPDPLVLGLRLSDPAGPWPAASTDAIPLTVDADGDGKPGLTSLVQSDGMFTASPTSILQTERIDASYVASRMAFRATLDDAACADTLEGTAEVLALDLTFVGCHVLGRDDCRSEELAFFEENRPQQSLGTTAVVHAAVIPLDASCVQTFQALEVPVP
jgi:hypothetical protein